MFEHIERLRKKSDAEKLRVVFGVSMVVTLVIGAFWGVAVVLRIESGSMSFEVNSSNASSLRSLGAKLGDSWGEFFPSAPLDAASQATVSSDSGEGSDKEISAERVSPYHVLLGAPESVEPIPVYPADVY